LVYAHSEEDILRKQLRMAELYKEFL